MPTTVPRGRARAAAGRPGPSARRRRRSGTPPRVRRGERSTASRTPGTASTGSIDTTGFDGAIDDGARPSSIARARRARAGRRRRRRSGRRRTGTSWLPLHEVLLEADLGSRPSSSRPSPSCAAGRRSPAAARAEPPAGGDLGGDLVSGAPSREPLGAVQVGAEVAVAEAEPAGAAVAAPAVVHRLPRLAGQAPAGLGVDRRRRACR